MNVDELISYRRACLYNRNWTC